MFTLMVMTDDSGISIVACLLLGGVVQVSFVIEIFRVTL